MLYHTALSCPSTFYPWTFKFWEILPTLSSKTQQNILYIFRGMCIIFHIHVFSLKLQALKNTEATRCLPHLVASAIRFALCSGFPDLAHISCKSFFFNNGLVLLIRNKNMTLDTAPTFLLPALALWSATWCTGQ